MAELVLRKLCKSFGPLQVIHEVDLTVRDGEFCVFVGPSGCGKSTLLRLIAGLEDATAGEISIDGERVEALPPAKRGVAMVFQSYALYPHMTARKNMAFGLELAKKGRAAVAEAVEKAAEILQLSQYLDRLPRELSGGQRQRVAIGRAIVRDPKLFLFDEPLSNLDAALRVQTRIEIAKLHKDMGATTIYVTHDQVEAMTLADKIVVLREGRVEQVGAPLELYHRPANRFVAGFIGSPRMNFVDVQVLGASSEGVRVALPGGAEVVAEVSAEGVSEGETLVLGVRPEHVGSAVEAGKTAFGAAPAREKGASDGAAEREKAGFGGGAARGKAPFGGGAEVEKEALETVAAVEKPGSGGGAEGGKPGSGAPLTGRVEVVESLGDSHLLHLDLADGQRIILRGPGDPEAAEGETLPLRVAGRDCHLFRGDGSALRRLD